MRKIVKLTFMLFVFLLYSALLIYVIHRPTLKVIAQWQKPESVHYGGANDSLPFYFDVVEGELNW
ncbi:MAG TPA: hypothetical protein VGI63_05820, partial [Verrucomicrobiae bacterium]